MTTEMRDLFVTKQPILTGGYAKYKATAALKKKFTGESRFGDEYPIYRESSDNKYLYLPRAVCPLGEQDVRVRGHKIKFTSSITLRKKQVPIVREASKLLKQDESFILQAHTGFGKTVVGCELISRVGRPTLIIVPKEDLIDTWYDAVKNFLGLKPHEIGLIRQDVCDYKGKKVVIAMLHSLCIEGRYPASIRKYFGFVIYDEVHRLGAEEFSKVCGMFSALLRLGLSATPNRADGKEALFQAHIGPVRVQSLAKPMKFKVLRFYTDWKCPRHKKKGKIVRVKHSAARIGHILPSIIKDDFTNKRMANMLKKCYDKGRFIIFFSDRKEHLDMMMELANEAGIKYRDMAYYVGGMKKYDREQAKGKRILFATYMMMKEGTDIPWFDTIIFGTPRSDIEQAAGRILREYPDKVMPIMFDRIDKDSAVFLGYSQRRGEYYARMGAEVKNLEFDNA